jgi:hypothetical protein
MSLLLLLLLLLLLPLCFHSWIDVKQTMRNHKQAKGNMGKDAGRCWGNMGNESVPPHTHAFGITPVLPPLNSPQKKQRHAARM